MITRVHIKNYRSLENVDVELGHLTVLVGRNGAGKSNFVDAIKFVQESLQIGIEAAVSNRNGLALLRRWTARGRPCEIEIEIEVKRGNLSGSYSFVVAGSQDNEFRVKREACRVVQNGNSPLNDEFEIRDGKWLKTPGGQNNLVGAGSTRLAGALSMAPLNLKALFLPTVRIMDRSPFGDVLLLLTGSSFFSIYPNTMREPQRFSTERRMGDNGEHFSSALLYLIQQQKPIAELLAALRKIADDVSDVRVKHIGGYLITEVKHDYQRASHPDASDGDSPWFELSQESDGTLRMLGLLIGLYQTRRPRGLIAVEEPEVNIHPGALAVLAEALQEVSEQRQVLLTTQSPDLISRFPVDCLRVVDRRRGSTRIGAIASSQRKAINEELFSTGDLMRIEGLYSSEDDNTEYA